MSVSMYQVCTRYAPSIYQVCTKYVPGMYQVCTRYAPGMYQVCTRYVQGMYHVYTRYVQGMYQVCPRYAPGMHTERVTQWLLGLLSNLLSFVAVICIPSWNRLVTVQTGLSEKTHLLNSFLHDLVICFHIWAYTYCLGFSVCFIMG